jgi:hypothetical protein
MVDEGVFDQHPTTGDMHGGEDVHSNKCEKDTNVVLVCLSFEDWVCNVSETIFRERYSLLMAYRVTRKRPV